MSLRFDATTDRLYVSGSLPSRTAFTLCGWARAASIPASTFRSLCSISAGVSSPSGAFDFAWYASGALSVSTYYGSGDQTVQFSATPAVGEWFFFAMTGSASSVDGYVGRVTDAALLTVSNSLVAPFTPGAMGIGDNGWSEGFNGNVAGVRVWDAVLTAAELEQERWTLAPRRRANLNRWAPVINAAVADAQRDWYQALNFTAAGTLTVEDGPPVGYGASALILPFAASGTSAVQNDLDARWSLIAAAQADADLRWALLNSAQADADVRWAMLSALQADADMRWQTVAGVAGDLDARWSLLNGVQADADLRWGLLNAAQADVDARWSQLAAAQSDLELQWSVASALSAVQADLDLRWAVLAAAQVDLDARWQTIADVTSEIDARWGLLNAAQADVDLRWAQLAAVQSDVDARWSQLAAVVADADLRWAVGAIAVLGRRAELRRETAARPTNVFTPRPRATSPRRPH